MGINKRNISNFTNQQMQSVIIICLATAAVMANEIPDGKSVEFPDVCEDGTCQ